MAMKSTKTFVRTRDTSAVPPLMAMHGYIPHVRARGEEACLIKHSGFKAKRWVVEAFHSWLKRWRKIHTRYEKHLASFAGLVALAAALIVFQKIHFICG
jgi:transposase